MLMRSPPTQHPPSGLCQDDSAQIIPLIVSTCVDAQLGPSFPQTRVTGSLRAADRQRDLLSLKWNVDFQAFMPFLINQFPLLPSAHPSLHTCQGISGLYENSCLEQGS